MKHTTQPLVVLLFLHLPAVFAQSAKVNGPIAPDGTEINLDLPNKLHLKNKGGSDGSGLCVFTSISHSARWQNVALLNNFRDYMTRYPGGGWPQKVDQMIARIAAERKTTKPGYVQITGTDLEVLRLAVKTGRMPAVTYSYSPMGRYRQLAAVRLSAHRIHRCAAPNLTKPSSGIRCQMRSCGRQFLMTRRWYWSQAWILLNGSCYESVTRAVMRTGLPPSP